VVVAVTATVVAVGVVVVGVVAFPVVLVLSALANMALVPFLGSQWVLPRAVLSDPVLTVVLSGVALLPLLYLGPVRSEIDAFHEELGVHGQPTDADLVRTVTNLAQQADIAEPDVYVTRRRRPESYAVGGRSDGAIVVTWGLVSALSEAELRAVLAHEVSHLANGDSRLMGLLLAPMLVVEHLTDRDAPGSQPFVFPEPVTYVASRLLWAVVSVVASVQRLGNQFGIAVLSRERELAADSAAARLTGEPSALASALETLDDERDPPEEDLRTWAQSAGVLDILPAEESPADGGPFRTHPPTEERVRRLRELAAEMEA
jgi:heat shock protein HtpX